MEPRVLQEVPALLVLLALKALPVPQVQQELLALKVRLVPLARKVPRATRALQVLTHW